MDSLKELNKLSEMIIGEAIAVHKELGSWFVRISLSVMFILRT